MNEHDESFLEDPRAHDTWKKPPSEREPEPSPAETGVTGHGSAADGLIRAVVGEDGRMRDLQLDPQLFRRGRQGLAMDTGTLAQEVTSAVNAALDDLARAARERSDLGELEKNLEEVTSGVESALEQVATDLARARRYLES